MHVFGRLLYGRMLVLSFDRVELPESHPFQRRCSAGQFVAQMHGDNVIGPLEGTYGLKPCEGNIHEIQALEDVAFLDVLSPPYDATGNAIFVERTQWRTGRAIYS